MQNLNLTLHQLEMSVLVDKDGPRTRLFLGPLRNKELKQALQRALNTWDDAPQWLFDLDRALTEDPMSITEKIWQEEAEARPLAGEHVAVPKVFLAGDGLYEGDGWGVV